MKCIQNKNNIFSTLAMLMVLSFVVSIVALPNAFVQADDTQQQSYSGSGQIATSHWEIGRGDTIVAFFAEQLTTPTGTIIPNGLYIEVVHATANGGQPSIAVQQLSKTELSQDNSKINITIDAMPFTWGTGSRPHQITIDWSLDSTDISPTQGYIDSSNTWIPALGTFYTTEAYITIDGAPGTGNHPVPYKSDWAYVGKTTNPLVSSGSGQIAMAHWAEQGRGLITIDAVFAEQLTTNTGAIITNGLYIKIVHAGMKAISEEIITLSDNDISRDNSQIHISTKMTAQLGSRVWDHIINIDWTFNTKTVLSKDDFNYPFVTFAPTSGEFYAAKADIEILGDASMFHPGIYKSVWATANSTPKDNTLKPTVSAFVTKLNGNKNDLTIIVTEFNSNGVSNEIKKTFSINNNAAGTYQVGNYNVYVDTKGNDQIRACYISSAIK
jgi:hypothetical protein